MKVNAIWDLRICKDLMESSDISNELDALLDAVHCAHADHACMNYCDDLFYQVINDEYFFDWLYDKNSDPEIISQKRELSILLSKGVAISKSEYDTLIRTMQDKKEKDNLLCSFHRSQEDVTFVFDIESYLSAKRWFLSNYTKKDDFLEDAKICFENLFFNDNINQSINTLCTDFKIVRPHIVKHLEVLDDFRAKNFQPSDISIGFRELSKKIISLYSIECSPQAGRESIDNVTFVFKDYANNKRSICCELHTKLKWHDMDKQNQDRIYFHPGGLDFADGKLLIGYIGRHL